MDKDKILAKAQKVQNDERYNDVLIKGTLIGLVMMIVTVVFLIIWRVVHGELIYDYMLIVLSQLIAFSIFQYMRLPEKKIYVLLLPVLIIMFIANLVVYIASFGGM